MNPLAAIAAAFSTHDKEPAQVRGLVTLRALFPALKGTKRTKRSAKAEHIGPRYSVSETKKGPGRFPASYVVGPVETVHLGARHD